MTARQDRTMARMMAALAALPGLPGAQRRDLRQRAAVLVGQRWPAMAPEARNSTMAAVWLAEQDHAVPLVTEYPSGAFQVTWAESIDR